MCKALRDMCEKNWRKGREEGIKEGIKCIIMESLDEGQTEEKILYKLQKYFSLTAQESMQYLFGVSSGKRLKQYREKATHRQRNT